MPAPRPDQDAAARRPHGGCGVDGSAQGQPCAGQQRVRLLPGPLLSGLTNVDRGHTVGVSVRRPGTRRRHRASAHPDARRRHRPSHRAARASSTRGQTSGRCRAATRSASDSSRSRTMRRRCRIGSSAARSKLAAAPSATPSGPGLAPPTRRLGRAPARAGVGARRDDRRADRRRRDHAAGHRARRATPGAVHGVLAARRRAGARLRGPALAKPRLFFLAFLAAPELVPATLASPPRGVTR